MIMSIAARRATSFVLCLAAALFIASPASAEDVVPSSRVRSNVVVRAEPMGAPAPAIGALRPGERAELLESVPYFYRVRLPNGVVGYVSKSWTVLVADETETLAAATERDLELHFIDVGQGDSTLILCPNGSTILVDAGSTSGRSPDEVRQYVMSQIGPRGGDIDYLIVSHPDADHYNLLAEVLDGVPIGRAWYVGQRSDYSQAAAFDWIRTTPATAQRLSASDHDPQATPNSDIDCGAADLWILAAAVEHSDSRKNAMSIVLMVRMDDFEAIITGDATHATENVIMSRYSPAWLDVDVLRVGHHGSLATSTSTRWANMLSPQTAIFSAGYENSYGHPRAEVVERLTPHTASAPAHGFRDARRNPDDNGPRYLFVDRTDYDEAVYTTAMSRTIVIRTTGQDHTTEINR